MCPLKFEVRVNVEPDAQGNVENSMGLHTVCLGGRWGRFTSPVLLSPQEAEEWSSGSYHTWCRGTEAQVREGDPSHGVPILDKGLVV